MPCTAEHLAVNCPQTRRPGPALPGTRFVVFATTDGMAERTAPRNLMRSEHVTVPSPHPQTRNELQAWVRENLHLAATLESSLLSAIDAVFSRHERLWQE